MTEADMERILNKAWAAVVRRGLFPSMIDGTKPKA